MAKQTARVSDRPQSITLTIEEAVAITGTVTQFPTSLTTRDKVGLLIKKIEFLIEQASWATIVGAGDHGAIIGVTQLYNGGVAPTIDQLEAPGLVGLVRFLKFGITEVGILNYREPCEVNLPDDGILVHPASLYGFIRGYGIGVAIEGRIRMTYTYQDLSDAEYQEILQTIIIQNAL